jgi:hypothetical protein
VLAGQGLLAGRGAAAGEEPAVRPVTD